MQNQPYTELIIFLSTDTKTRRQTNPSWQYLKELREKNPEISKLVKLVTIVYCEDQPEVARSFSIKEVPTTVLLVDDSEVARNVGVLNYELLSMFVLNAVINKSIDHS